jgi:hypothetical protein
MRDTVTLIDSDLFDDQAREGAYSTLNRIDYVSVVITYSQHTCSCRIGDDLQTTVERLL